MKIPAAVQRPAQAAQQRGQVFEALGDQVAVMDNGRVVHAGSMAALAADEALQQSLLGLSL